MGPATLITTVQTPASSYDLASLPDVKAEMEIDVTTWDSILQRYITSASTAATQYCNRVFQAETIKDEFWARRDPFPRVVRGGYDKLQLSRWPLVSVTSVTENGTALVDQTDFRIDYAMGQLIRLTSDGHPRSWPVCSIVVVYVGGFATILADVNDAVIRMVKARFSARGRDPYLMEETITGAISQRWWVSSGATGNMTPDVTDLLDNYRVPVIG